MTQAPTDRSFVVEQRVAAPPAQVFAAWARPELFRRWWLPETSGLMLADLEMWVETGGHYRLAIVPPGRREPMVFHGRYVEVIDARRIVWTNEEEADGAVTTVTFAEQDGATRVTVTEVYPTAAALDAAVAEGSTSGWPEQLRQLDTLVTG